MSETRLERLLSLMREQRLDAVVINPGSSLTYLTGLHFHLMERPTLLIITRDHQPTLVLPELERGKVAAAHISIAPVTYNDDPASWPEVFAQALGSLALKHARIGVEPTRLRFLEASFLQNAEPSIMLVSAEKVFDEIRLYKDAEEINEIRRAVDIAQRSLLQVLPMVKPGRTEKEIAAELAIQLVRNGSDPELPFYPIVAAGPNSANPHAVPSERALCQGDLLVIDWGARFNGYCSDLTRTYAIGKLEADLENIHKIVQQANTAGRAAGAPAVAAGEVDRAARDVIQSAGFGDYFTHRTGHGFGLEDHEPPYIFKGNHQRLEAGMTYTVEPGIYIPGKGGVRIEDNMLITHNGCETLSDLPRNLVFL